MKVIFYDRVYDENDEQVEVSGLDTVMFGDERLTGVRRLDEIREERIALADVHQVEVGRPRGKGRMVRAFGVQIGFSIHFFRCYVIAEESKKP